MFTRLFLLTILYWPVARTDTHPSAAPAPARAQRPLPDSTEGNYEINNFPFQSGETTLPVLRLHYTTFGRPVRDAKGKVTNAILIMHGTTGNGHNFINQLFAGHLFQPGQLLDASRYYIILPDAIGHGKSSKPSDGLHMRFPKYTYDDMVLADYRLLTEHLGVNHLRLCMGTSMGAMHTWVWGYTYPDFMDALMPLASLPVAIAGRNRIMRKMAIEGVEDDPAWNNGEYASPPVAGLRTAYSSLFFMTSSPWHLQERAPTRDAAEKVLDRGIDGFLKTQDANDLIYAFDASRDYDPSPHLDKIRAPLFAINSADDEVNPPELGIMEKEIKKVPKGRYILIPWSEKTSGHGTHTDPTVWGDYLRELLVISKPPAFP
ncbi:MAG TPA: alpha/beta fold hydrolase [Dinghuibacter sp.]|uniref:alpha/beta fold hydrolase n=1 Tax=Dinghuibacter sp. TaxID=2024697 RepID=UPI002B988CA7|nr:alpha/beta fold hydrolase [Dinghuibacter sp.]HTJ11478.1 alpha/beta fold hydrolase [Dinghuibacter sp.]